MKNNRRSVIMAINVAIMILLMPQVSYATRSTDSNFGRYTLVRTNSETALAGTDSDRKGVTKEHKALTPLTVLKRPRYRYTIDDTYRSSTVDQDRVATIMLTGDIMCQARQQKAALEKYGEYNFNDSFEYVRKIFSKADFVVGNLETTLSETSPYMSELKFIDNRPNCNAPSTFLDSLRYAGFDMVTCSNNHNCDAGARGILQTIEHLNQYGLIHTGVFSDSHEPRYVIAQIDGINVGFVAYSDSFNGKDSYLHSDEQDVMINGFSPDKVKMDIAACRDAGAEFIIAFNHCGIEYTTAISDRQIQQAKVFADAGADLIIGAHPHVLQEYSQVQSDSGKKVDVMYSMGNFISSMYEHDASKDSIIMKISLQRNLEGKIEIVDKCYIPCRCVTKYADCNYAVVPITKKRYQTAQIKEAFKRTYNRENRVIGSKLPMEESYKY